MAYTAWSVVFGEQPTAAKWNQLGENDAGLKDGTNIDTDAIIERHILNGEVSASKLLADAVGHGLLEIARTTLGSNGDTITVTGIPARRYLMILVNILGTGNLAATLRFNNDSGNNYSRRISINGGADSTTTSTNSIYVESTSISGNMFFTILNVINIATREKVMHGNSVARATAGAAATPNRTEFTGKWINTSNLISRVDLINTDTGDFVAGSEVIILGSD